MFYFEHLTRLQYDNWHDTYLELSLLQNMVFQMVQVD